jgi:hypothetical protein
MAIHKQTILTLIILLIVCNITVSKPAVGLTLTESVKANLISAQPLLGKKVNLETFTKVPVLISFFASW